jgi:hypothetical protein
MALALASFSGTMISLSPTTSSSAINICCATAIAVLVFLLAVSDVMSKGESRDERKATALRILCVPLIAVFFAFFVYVLAQLF